MEMAKSSAGIELRHIRYFLAAAEHGSFRKAGMALNIQESAVSRRVRDLEDRLGASLFHRNSSGVCLTCAGQKFLRRARQIIRTLDEGAHEVATLGRSEIGNVRVGINSSIASGFLTELFRAYGHRYASVDIELIDGDHADHVTAIRQLRIDVAFLTGTTCRLDCDLVHLWSERIFAALPDDHMLAAREDMTWQDLREESFIVSDTAPGEEIHSYLIRRLAGFGQHPEIRVQSVGWDNLLPLVALGKGLTVINEAMTATQFPGIIYRPILGEMVPFCAVWSPRNDNPAFRRFLSLARSMAPS
jgi:DNA-binding transcriptional LysR family regulator